MPRPCLRVVERVCVLLCQFGIPAMYFLVAGGTAYRLFSKDMPQREDWRTFLYFAALLVLLGVVIHFSPNVDLP